METVGFKMRKASKSAMSHDPASGENLLALRERVDRLKEGRGLRQNTSKAFSLAVKGAELGDPYLTWYVGDAFEYGEGVKRSARKARRYYEAAVGLGSVDAMTALGVYYWDHARSAPDRQKALSLYRRAARRNEPNALHNIGVCYSVGRIVRKNLPMAYSFFLRAAELGHVEAQFKVGWCLIYGEGVPIDENAGRKWLKKAAHGGQTDAIELLSSGNK
jgi:uncharacterized protein